MTRYKWLTLFTFCIALSISCNKSNNLSSQPNIPSIVTFVNFLNLASYSEPSYCFLNNTQETQSLYANSYTAGYSPFIPGNYAVTFKTINDSIEAQIASAFYDTSVYYSVYLYNPTHTTISAARINDDFSVVNGASAFYRFLHVTPDAPSVDLYFNGNLAQQNRAPEDNISDSVYNSFQPVNGGSYVVSAKKTGTDSVVAQLNAGASFSLANGSAYTFLLLGTTDSLTIQVLQVSK